MELTIGEDGVAPPELSVPGFLALELVVRNELDRAVRVRVRGGEPPRELSVEAGRTMRLRMPGRRPGRYAIDAGSAGSAVLVAGVEPGP